MTVKQRLSASVDADLFDAGQAAVAAGEADSLSAWVNDALRRQAEHDRRLRALGGFLATYEAEHGEITDPETADEAARRARGRAVVIGGDPASGSGSPSGRAA